ncbi:DUF1801 domain-containing protein [Porifericola rhodea]|uniref:DUF1801 domain-containing protein n=1 Tax=Porifericola rhodea TaxID=930972 RepID=UPI0026669152|nr:DUF1801 domain-containing protein [Porifericola rhodea]WKN30187.1 DUF1801 domain-containing protein [Porifericola rhodea]
MEVLTQDDVKEVLEAYPSPFDQKIKNLRQLILDTAEAEGVSRVVESLKWGEPAYLVKGGSTIRINTIKNRPEHYAMYFICSTGLVKTFRILYDDLLQFEGKRAIVFHKNEGLPITQLRHCISLALNYHRIKHLPMLGA